MLAGLKIGTLALNCLQEEMVRKGTASGIESASLEVHEHHFLIRGEGDPQRYHLCHHLGGHFLYPEEVTVLSLLRLFTSVLVWTLIDWLKTVQENILSTKE
ncbi:hypothetical protein ACJX0J_018185 [Zea mays]